MIAFGTYPIITRIYEPAEFGVFAAFTAFVASILPISTLGYSSAIVQPKEDFEAQIVARLCIISGFVVTILSIPCVYYGKKYLVGLSGLENTPNAVYFIPATILLFAFSSTFDQIAIRKSRYKEKAIANVGSTFLNNTTKLVGGFFYPKGPMLIVATQLGNFIYVVVSMRYLSSRCDIVLRSMFDTTGIMQVARSYSSFFKYRMPQGMLYYGSVGLPIVLMAEEFGKGSAGQYSLAALVLGAFVSILGQAVSEVLYPKITIAINDRSADARKYLKKSIFGLLGLSLMPFGLILILGDMIFSSVFGNQWQKAGEYGQWMSLWFLSTLITYVCIAAMPALGKQHVLLIREILSIILKACAVLIGAYIFQSDICAIALLSIVSAMINFWLIIEVFFNVSSIDNN